MGGYLIAGIRTWLENKWVRAVAPYLAATIFVLLADWFSQAIFDLAHVRRVSMVYLCAVLFTAMNFGARPGLFAALLSFGMFNSFLIDPSNDLSMNSTEQVITLAVFFAVAIATGGLAGRVRDEALRTKARANTNAVLLAASGEMSAIAEEERLRANLVTSIARATDGEAVLVDANHRHAFPPLAAGASHGALIAAALASKPNEVTMPDGWRARAVLLHDIELGVILWRPGASAARAIDDLSAFVNVLVDLAAASIARARLADEHAEAQAQIRAERLQATLLSSMSHDFRTPLSAILTSASGLLEYGDTLSRETRADLYLTIQEEAERLNRFVANLLNMTRIEAGVLDVEQTTFDADEVIRRVVSRAQKAHSDKQIQCADRTGPLIMRGDPMLLEHALLNVVENAMRFTPPEAPVSVACKSRPAAITLQVTDSGPGVAEKDRERIFEKFFRADGDRRQQNVGLGLSIVKGLVEAMGGSVRADARADGASGLCVTIELPAPA